MAKHTVASLAARLEVMEMRVKELEAQLKRPSVKGRLEKEGTERKNQFEQRRKAAVELGKVLGRTFSKAELDQFMADQAPF